ncbi:MAG: 1-deoxy-D-xylulose-5-phosphate reductoisomerase, partial [Desulfatirhabdiaceae bacterium]
GLSIQQISVLIHPQSIIHSMVAYRDGSVMAQLGIPDMKTAIAYALSHPERLNLVQPLPDFARIGSFTFENPDMDRFPCLQLALDACHTGGTLPAVMNAANEAAVQAFLNREIPFTDIPKRIDRTMQRHPVRQNPSLDDILHADQWARRVWNEED